MLNKKVKNVFQNLKKAFVKKLKIKNIENKSKDKQVFYNRFFFTKNLLTIISKVL